MDVHEYLKEQGVEFEVIPHEQAFTAQEVAAVEHETGHHVAKTVIAKSADDYFMFVLPASRYVDLQKASQVVGEELELAEEEEMKDLFPDCEVGAEPPFGGEYGLPTYVDAALDNVNEIVFRDGTHNTTVKVDYADYKRLAKPTVANFAVMED